MNDLIEQLAGSKAFEQLSPAEQHLVLEQMSKPAYDQLHVLLKALPAIHANQYPPAHLKQDLMKRMATQHNPVPKSHRISEWMRVAAVLVMGMVMGYILANDKVQVVEKQVLVPEYIQITDTVFVPHTVWRTSMKWHYDTIVVETPIGSIASAGVIRLDSLADDCWYPQASVGTALGNTPNLMNFFVQPDPE